MRALRNTLEALKASNALSSITPSHSYTELAQKIAKRAAQNWTVRDVRQQKSRFPNDSLVFVKRPPKDFDLAELARFVRRDAEVSGVKFRFMAEDVGFDGMTISPLLRRLLNNGAYYTVFGNTAERTKQVLDNMKMLPLPVQVTLVETKRKDEAPSYREVVAPPKDMLVQIEIDKTRYSLSTPSLSLLTRMKGIGIPENHPEHSKLVNVSVPHPWKPSMFIVFHSIPPTEDKTLVALIPGHIEQHRQFFSPLEPIERPGLIQYEDTLYSLSELDGILAKRLDVPPPLISTCPFISTKHYNDDGEAVTMILDGDEVLDSSKFFNLPTQQRKRKSRSVKTVQITTRTKDFPLSQINNGEIYDILKFTAQSRMFRGVGVITADMLRGTIIDSDVISGDLLNEKKVVLELLNQGMHWYHQSPFVSDEVEWVESLKGLLENGEAVDKALVKSLYSFAKDQKELNNFVIQLSNYIVFLESQVIYQKGLSQERKQFITQLLGNVLVRALQDPIRRLFPEFANFWVKEFEAFDKVRTPTLSKHKLTNDWNHYVEYLMESNVKVPQEAQQLLDVTGLLYGYPHMPAPFGVQFEVCGIKSTEDKEFLNFVVEQFGTQVVFVDRVEQIDNRDYLEPVYDSFGVVVVPFRTVPDLTSLNEESSKWCEAFCKLDAGEEEWGFHALKKIKQEVRQSLKYNDHYRMVNEIPLLYTFLKTRFLESPTEFQRVLKEYQAENKDRVVESDEAFKAVGPEHVEKQINEFL